MTTPSALYLPGTSGNYASTPIWDSSWTLADHCVIWHGTLDDVSPSSHQTLCGNYSGGNGFILRIDPITSDYLRTYISSGVTTISDVKLSSVFSDGEEMWVAVTNALTGSYSMTSKFWYSSDGTSWSQLGSTQVDSGTASTATADMWVGSYDSAAAVSMSGKVYDVEFYTGIGANTAPGQGTLVAEFRADAPIEPRYRDSTGKIWTLNGSAYSFVEVS